MERSWGSVESSAEGMKPVTHGGSWQDRGEGTVPHILPQLQGFLLALAAHPSSHWCCLQSPVPCDPFGDPSSRCPGSSSPQGQPQVFLWAHTHRHTCTSARDHKCVCWCVGRAGLAAAGHSDVPCPAAPPQPCCLPRPAILGRESRMGTVFFHFKVSRGAAWTHRPFVQPLRVPPAVILLKFVCDLRRLCLLGGDLC